MMIKCVIYIYIYKKTLRKTTQRYEMDIKVKLGCIFALIYAFGFR